VVYVDYIFVQWQKEGTPPR